MVRVVDLLHAIRTSADDGDAPAWIDLSRLASEMDATGRDRTAPMREVFALLGDRWTMLILLALAAGTWRHATLRRIIGALAIEGAISQRILTLKLRALERDGFVVRRASDDVPPQVDYALSERGRTLLVHARALLEWIRLEREAIEDARAIFDARND